MLRFQFMAANALLGTKRFEWAKYLSRSSEHFIAEMIEIPTQVHHAHVALVKHTWTHT